MKNFRSFFIFISSSLFILNSSCNIEPYEGDVSPEINENTPNVEAGALQVDFDGKTVSFDITSATVSNNVINISGLKSSSQEALVLNVFASSIGTYQLGVTVNQVEVNSVAYANTGSGKTWTSVKDFVTSQGEITITEIDETNKTISGTFFFTGYDSTSASKDFTKGVFNKIPYASDVPSGNSNNTFFAKVDGVEFVEDGIGGALLSFPGTPSIITISATKNSFETISISVSSNITSGTYDFSTFDPPMGQYNLSLTEGTVSDSGVLTITSHDIANKRIVGTFSFKASPLIGTGNSYEITEGSFDVTYL